MIFTKKTKDKIIKKIGNNYLVFFATFALEESKQIHKKENNQFFTESLDIYNEMDMDASNNMLFEFITFLLFFLRLINKEIFKNWAEIEDYFNHLLEGLLKKMELFDISLISKNEDYYTEIWNECIKEDSDPFYKFSVIAYSSSLQISEEKVSPIKCVLFSHKLSLLYKQIEKMIQKDYKKFHKRIK